MWPHTSGHESCHSFSYNQQLFALAVAAGRLYKILLVAKAAASRSHRFELLRGISCTFRFAA
jgi:hypothetical protein